MTQYNQLILITIFHLFLVMNSTWNVYSRREVGLHLTEIVLNYEWQTTRQIKESLGDIPCLSYK